MSSIPIYIRNMRQKQELIMTQWIGTAGVHAICDMEKDQIRARFSPMFMRRLEKCLPVREADTRTAGERRDLIAEILKEDGAVAGSFREVTEGGIWNALWYLAEANHCGLRVDIDAMPIKQEAIEICEMFGIHPYYLTSGEDTILAAVDHGKKVIDQLAKQGIAAVCIGYTTDDKDRILKQGETDRYLDRPRKKDELQRFIEERKACI